MLRIAHDVNSRRLTDSPVSVRDRLVHGYRRAFRVAGEGPALLLIHGIGDDSRTWEQVIPLLARDQLAVLDIDRVTLVGHSLGGGVAMQFAYQFPEQAERLVLVASGGAGRAV